MLFLFLSLIYNTVFSPLGSHVMYYTDKLMYQGGAKNNHSLTFIFCPRTNPPSPSPVSFTFLLFLLSKLHFDVLVVLCSTKISVSSQSPSPFSPFKASALPSPLSCSGTYMRGRFPGRRWLQGPPLGLRAEEPLHVCTFSASLFQSLTCFLALR